MTYSKPRTKETKNSTVKKLRPLFWEYDLKSLQDNLSSPFVIARVLEISNPEQFRIYSSLVKEDVIVDFLEKKGQKLLSKRAYNFWQLYYEKKANKSS
ncbi:MAG: hypothetical protein N2202_09740 [Proteobacteria bacterium]|nr:hypothetical protein [Pseudomonadota bacterium]